MTAAQSDHIAGIVMIAVALLMLLVWLVVFVAREWTEDHR